MRLSIIVAMSRNNAIGVNNELPWHLPEDLKNFKKLSLNKPIIMGRNTFDSIGRPLPERDNIVLSRNAEMNNENIFLANNQDRALDLAEGFAKKRQCDEIMIIGGEQIYRMFFRSVSRIYLTLVDTHINGDAFFPALDKKIWVEKSVSHDMHENGLIYQFLTLEKSQ